MPFRRTSVGARDRRSASVLVRTGLLPKEPEPSRTVQPHSQAEIEGESGLATSSIVNWIFC